MSIASQSSTKRRKIVGLILAMIGTFFIIAAKYHKTTLNVVPVAQSPYKSIILDLGEVLFTTKSTAKASIIATTILKNPSLLYFLIGFPVKNELFKILHTVPAQTTLPMYHQGKLMPQIMVDWQIAASNCFEVKNKVQTQINQSQHPDAIKKLFIAISDLMFDPETFASSQSPIVPMVHLAQKLKQAGYQIYALSNWDPESFAILKEKHPQVFNIFDGILISGQENIGKPAPEFYQRLLQKYNLKSSECIFIDDESYNIQAAQEIGINPIVCDTQTNVLKQLIKLGVVLLPS